MPQAQVPFDRLKDSLRRLARGAFPETLYARLWRAKLVQQKSSLRVDVQPYDTRLPPMANIPLKVGIPGVEVKIAPGHDVAVGWEDGRPDRPYATLWTPGLSGTKPLGITVHTDSLDLGGPGGESLILGDSYRAAEQKAIALVLAWCQAATLAFAGTAPTPAPSKALLATLMANLNTAIVEFNNLTYLSGVSRTV